MAIHGGVIYREMVAQYTLLGDPLMMLDAGPPVVTSTLLGEPDQEISGEFDLTSTDASNQSTIEVVAKDEAGISRLQVTDSTGADLTSSVATESLPEGQDDHQEVNYELVVPVRPFDHQILIDVYDTGAALESDSHYTLVLNINQDATFSADGELIDPAVYAFPPDTEVDFQCEMTSSSWLDENSVYELRGDNLVLSNIQMGSSKTNSVSFSFTALAEAGTTGERSVILDVDGFETTYVLEEEKSGGTEASISQVLNYPNPMKDGTRFLYETNAVSGEGKVRVFAVSGRIVANVPFVYTGGTEGVIEWNGRDDDGDSLANGTYLYRLEMNTSAGLVVSPMQRLVVMN
ncbi:MAG: T9SS type A sorting domain-containing protein [bacterium]|nr:T9SS type A sorting domain-containing protein [bacterium]